MSFLRGSVNYVWCTTNVLGKGATGAVFQGVHKNTGEPVAVKTFNQLGQMRPPDVQVREFEVLKKVKHENIVKLLAIEEEQEGRGKVIVMELCTGGSLYNILDDPENTYGLQEEEFLLVVEHLTAGMKHLRDNNLIHRDLKPGNIMKFVAEDGGTVYKLTDFGAARELQEDQQFVSLYGTEEYLHPDMYERAVLRKPVGKTFGATVDLWSIGVTLYHVATGQLPFRPYGGRRNKETMYYITTKKASGVISGCQSSENGPVDWGRELPQNCRLSAGLRKVVTPLLAGLLEADPQRMWSFDRFFSEVTGVLSRRPVHVFHANRTQSVRVYLHPEDLLDQFRALVAEQTDVAPADQLLLAGDRELASVVADSTPGRAYPSTGEDDPVVLFSRDNNNVCVPPETDRPKFPAFPAPVSVENDAGVAKVACAVGYACKRRVEKLTRTGRLVHAGVERFTAVVCAVLVRLSERCARLCEVAAKVRVTAEVAARGEKTVEALLRRLGGGDVLDVDALDWPSELAVVVHELTANLAPAVRQLHRRYVTDGALRREWSAATRCLPSPSNPSARASTIVERLRDSWQHLLRDRAARSLSYNEEQFHALERIKVVEAGRRMRSLLDTECAPVTAQLADSLADWYKMAQTVYLQTQILDKDLDAFEGRLQDFCLRMSEGDSSFHVGAGTALGPAGEFRTRRKPLRGPSALRLGLEDVRVVQEEMAAALRENTDIIDQFRELLADVEGDVMIT